MKNILQIRFWTLLFLLFFSLLLFMVVLNNFNLYPSRMRAEYCVSFESCLMVAFTSLFFPFLLFCGFVSWLFVWRNKGGIWPIENLVFRMSIAPASKKLQIPLLTADALCIRKHLVCVLPKIQITATEWLHPEWRLWKPTLEWWRHKPIPEWRRCKPMPESHSSMCPQNTQLTPEML